MAVVSMSKILLLLHNEDKQKTLELLQDQGVMEILDLGLEGEKEATNTEEQNEINFKIAEVEFALEFLKKYAPALGGVEGLILGEKTKINSWREVESVQAGFAYQNIIEECKNIEEKQNSLQGQIHENKQTLDLLLPWKKLDLELQNDFSTKTTKLVVGFLKKNFVEACFAEFKTDFTYGECEIIEKQNDQVACWFLVQKEEVSKMEGLLQKYEFSEFTLPKFDGTPQAVIENLQKEQIELQSEFDNLTEKQKELAQEVPKLKIVYDYLTWLKDKEEIKNQLGYTQTTVSIQGFVPKKVLPGLVKKLQKIDKTIVVEEMEITEEDNVPVELENNKFIKPFEGVMKLFGLPASDEIDPTPYLTPFFLIFFGFCLTDVGYGLILAIGVFIALKLIKFPEDLKAMLRLLMYAGWATAFMGVLFGGYLGLTVEQVPEFMLSADGTHFKFQVFDSINNLNAVMGFAYGLGLIHLWLGTFLKGVNQWKTNKSEALQTSFIYNLLILFIIFLSLAKMGIFLPQAENILEKIVYVNIALAIWGSGYGQKWFVRPLIGIIVFLQEIINIFSAVLSYSRLFALGLSTGIIALVFNTIALTTLDLLPLVVAIPLMIIIILLGHTLNIALNLLGAFIHSARLQFVEFFGKFLAGGGKDYKPFKKEMKYIVVEGETAN